MKLKEYLKEKNNNKNEIKDNINNKEDEVIQRLKDNFESATVTEDQAVNKIKESFSNTNDSDFLNEMSM